MPLKENNYKISKLLASLIITLLTSVFFNSFCSGEQKKYNPLTIKITPNIWGGAKVSDIHKVLLSTARQFLPYFNQDEPFCIIVNRSKTGPIVLYKRGANGEYFVQLNTEKQFWSQYAFQFAHELGHIICGYKKGDRSNLWFEETICEIASLFALKGMTKEWNNKPPFPHWKSYGKEFSKYAEKRIEKHSWPANQSISNWYLKHKKDLQQNPSNRERNVMIASQLIHFFQENPESWKACKFLNIEKSNKKISFNRYLFEWKNACPTSKQKNFVNSLIKVFKFSD